MSTTASESVEIEDRYPVPSVELMHRVGRVAGEDVVAGYRSLGRGSRRSIMHAMTHAPDWTWADKRILDFGCGSGRVMRHMGPEAELARDYVGCDIDGSSVDWVNQNLPPFRAFPNEHAPPLKLDDGSVDFAYALSVFTHLTDHTYEWLLELHRVIADGGYLLATFLGPGMSESVAKEKWSASKFGQTFVGYARPWDPGPDVIHSAWWIREHWGRAFEIVRLRPWGFGIRPEPRKPTGHGWVLMRKIPGPFTVDEIAAPADDPYELPAALHANERYLAEIAELRSEIESLKASLSWRSTEPLRRAQELRAQLIKRKQSD